MRYGLSTNGGKKSIRRNPNMKKQFNVTPAQARYESPAINVMEMDLEGVLCASSEDWDEEILPE